MKDFIPPKQGLCSWNISQWAKRKKAIPDEQVNKKASQDANEVETACLTEEQAALYINMSRSFLRIARMQGALKKGAVGPSFVRNGRTIRYLKSDLDAWLQGNRVEILSEEK